MLDNEMLNNPFIRKSLKTFNTSMYARFPVMFASIKNENEKIQRLQQIKNSIHRDAINKLCEPVWNEQTRLRLSMTEYEKRSEDGSIEVITKPNPSSILPIPPDTLHRINLFYEIERSFWKQKINKVSTNHKIPNMTVVSCVNEVIEELKNGINDAECEIYYAFNTFPYHNHDKHINVLFNAEVIEFYEHLRNEILTLGDEFRHQRASNKRTKVKQLENELYLQEEKEGITTHQGILPLWDFMHIDGYIRRYKKLQDEQMLKICDVCGLLFYSSSKSEQSKHYCGVHIGGHSGAEIKQFMRKET